MTNTQVIRLLKNDDSTTIAFKRFNLSPRDKYPTFSMCFKGAELRWYNDKFIFDQYGISSSKYEKLLKGEKVSKYRYNYTSKLYDKFPVEYIPGASEDQVDKFSISISDILTTLRYRISPDEKSIEYKKREKGNRKGRLPLKIGYTSPDTICFTKSSNDSLDTVNRYDLLELDRAIFGNEKYQNVELKLFIHYPQQLLRAFHKPAFKSTVGDKNSGNRFWRNLLRITISDVTVLKKRPGSNVPCDESLVDDDLKLQLQIIKSIQCIPVYWHSVLKTGLNLEICNSTNELKRAYNFIQNYRRMFRTYDPPCIGMKVYSLFDREERNTGKDPRILFLYSEENYQEVKTTENFGFESFLSGVGGFVGIFLGYSMLQLPEIFILFNSFSRTLQKYRSSGEL